MSIFPWCQISEAGVRAAVVDAIFAGKDRAYNRRFEQMCGHYLVDPVACTPASGSGGASGRDPGRCRSVGMLAGRPDRRPARTAAPLRAAKPSTIPGTPYRSRLDNPALCAPLGRLLRNRLPGIERSAVRGVEPADRDPPRSARAGASARRRPAPLGTLLRNALPSSEWSRSLPPCSQMAWARSKQPVPRRCRTTVIPPVFAIVLEPMAHQWLDAEHPCGSSRRRRASSTTNSRMRASSTTNRRRP